MKRAGQIVVTAFPYTDLTGAKLRPVFVLCQASSRFDDWLVRMVSSRLDQAEADFDDIIRPTDADFATSGLKAASAFRLKRLAPDRQRASRQHRCGAVEPDAATVGPVDCRGRRVSSDAGAERIWHEAQWHADPDSRNLDASGLAAAWAVLQSFRIAAKLSTSVSDVPT